MQHAHAFVVVKGLLVMVGRLHTVGSRPPAPGTSLLSPSWILRPGHTALPVLPECVRPLSGPLHVCILLSRMVSPTLPPLTPVNNSHLPFNHS